MSPSGATCFHSNVVLGICTPGLTPNPSPEERGVGQEWLIVAPLQPTKGRALPVLSTS